jgi:hypothetical protein
MGARGEGVIELPDGSDVAVLFTNRALVEAEQAIEKSILALSREFEQGVFRIGDVAQLALVGMRAARRDARTGGPAPTLGDVYEILDQVGFSEVARVVVGAVAEVLAFSPDSDEESDPDPNA